ncbi:hypothetical protein Patl1_13961 [Pistacia atlantica]|uniref:Uncharacterized protein n=1 Tax=Pistacia atlantica TaxID=434234 RepID=A0ACC1AUQ1_9ROSI|nr:hypothetical protein Patl1_13961 [Pistacia atlantica]
MGYDNDPIR